MFFREPEPAVEVSPHRPWNADLHATRGRFPPGACELELPGSRSKRGNMDRIYNIAKKVA